MLVPVKWLVALVSAILSVFSAAPQQDATATPAVARTHPVQHVKAGMQPEFWLAQTPPIPPGFDPRHIQAARFIRIERLPGDGVRVTTPPQLPL